MLSTGSVMFVGGFGARTAIGSTVIFDPTTETFTPGPTMFTGRDGPITVVLKGDRALVAGGYGVDRSLLGTAEVFGHSLP